MENKRNQVKDFHEYVIGDVLGHIPSITSRAMFGGYALYYDGVIFGIITNTSELRFKVDAANRDQYEERGSTPFIYDGHKNKKVTVMQYYLVPESILEDRDAIEEWLLQSVAISKKRRT